tara:strand:- start:50 stop:232 length:183 start_codon:yes stop_codon:yes gene_type:complete
MEHQVLWVQQDILLVVEVEILKMDLHLYKDKVEQVVVEQGAKLVRMEEMHQTTLVVEAVE